MKVDLGSRGRFRHVPVSVGRISHIFIVKVDTLLRSISDTRFCVSLQSLLEECPTFSMAELVFCRILRIFSHSVRVDVSAHFSALDDEAFFVVEGSGWRGRRESDSQVFCPPCGASLTGMEKHSRQVTCPHHRHHNHHKAQTSFASSFVE